MRHYETGAPMAFRFREAETFWILIIHALCFIYMWRVFTCWILYEYCVHKVDVAFLPVAAHWLPSSIYGLYKFNRRLPLRFTCFRDFLKGMFCCFSVACHNYYFSWQFYVNCFPEAVMQINNEWNKSCGLTQWK